MGTIIIIIVISQKITQNKSSILRAFFEGLYRKPLIYVTHHIEVETD